MSDVQKQLVLRMGPDYGPPAELKAYVNQLRPLLADWGFRLSTELRSNSNASLARAVAQQLKRELARAVAQQLKRVAVGYAPLRMALRSMPALKGLRRSIQSMSWETWLRSASRKRATASRKAGSRIQWAL